MDEGDQRKLISRRLPDEDRGRGQKMSSDGNGDVKDKWESISRRLQDDNWQPVPTGTPQQFVPDTVGAVGGSKRKAVRWNSDVEEFESLAAWAGAKRDMADVRQKLGCDHDVSEFYSPPRMVKMA